jgi:Spy/CpxP family protein refolding chaperone
MRFRHAAAASLVMIALGSAAMAQHEQHAAAAAGAGTSTLTAEAVQQLLNGDGLGLARPAEMNGYPGPKHVLELKTELSLTADQERKVEAIRQQMLEAARPLGRSIVEAERALDESFKAGRMSVAELASGTAAIAGLQGQLRRAHLHAHLLTKPVLTAEQVRKYYELRAQP